MSQQSTTNTQANITAYQNIIQKLKSKVPFFANFSNEEMIALLQLSSRREFKNNENIFEEGSFGSEMFVILSGGVKISKIGENSEKIQLADLTVGDCFGEMSVIDRSKRSARADADGDIILLALHEEVLRKDLNLAYKLFKNFSILMANRLRITNKNYAEITSDEAKSRLKFNDIIKKYAEKGGSFENCNLRHSVFNNVIFSKGNMQNTMYVNSRISDCRMNGNLFEKSIFIGAEFNDSSFQDCTFNNVNLSASLLTKVDFKNCIFDDITLRQLEALGVNITDQEQS